MDFPRKNQNIYRKLNFFTGFHHTTYLNNIKSVRGNCKPRVFSGASYIVRNAKSLPKCRYQNLYFDKRANPFHSSLRKSIYTRQEIQSTTTNDKTTKFRTFQTTHDIKSAIIDSLKKQIKREYLDFNKEESSEWKDSEVHIKRAFLTFPKETKDAMIVMMSKLENKTTSISINNSQYIVKLAGNLPCRKDYFVQKDFMLEILEESE